MLVVIKGYLRNKSEIFYSSKSLHQLILYGPENTLKMRQFEVYIAVHFGT